STFTENWRYLSCYRRRLNTPLVAVSLPGGPPPMHSHLKRPVSRVFLAVSLVLLLVAQLVPALGAPPGSAADRFVDDDRSVHEGSINAIAEAGLVDGCNPPENDRFCPDRHIARAEMAKIIANAVGIPASANLVFRDVEDSIFRGSISGIGEMDIAKGCNPPMNDRFCPEQIVDRGQMAAF